MDALVIEFLLPSLLLSNILSGFVIGRLHCSLQLGGIVRREPGGCHRCTKHQVSRNSGLSAEHQEEWRVASGRVDTGIVCQTYLGDIVLPLKRVFFCTSGEHVQQGSVVPLNKAVTLRVIYSCSGLVDMQHLAHLSDKVRLKLLALV